MRYVWGACLLPSTLLLLPDGSKIRADEVTLSTMLVAETGEPTRVLSVRHSRDHPIPSERTRKMYTIADSAGGSHTVTFDHLVTLRVCLNPSVQAVQERVRAARVCLTWFDGMAANPLNRQHKHFLFTRPGEARELPVETAKYATAEDAIEAACLYARERIQRGEYVSASVCSEPYAQSINTAVIHLRLQGKQRKLVLFSIQSKAARGHSMQIPVKVTDADAKQFALRWLAKEERAGRVRPLHRGDFIDVPAEAIAQHGEPKGFVLPRLHQSSAFDSFSLVEATTRVGSASSGVVSVLPAVRVVAREMPAAAVKEENAVMEQSDPEEDPTPEDSGGEEDDAGSTSSAVDQAANSSASASSSACSSSAAPPAAAAAATAGTKRKAEAEPEAKQEEENTAKKDVGGTVDDGELDDIDAGLELSEELIAAGVHYRYGIQVMPTKATLRARGVVLAGSYAGPRVTELDKNTMSNIEKAFLDLKDKPDYATRATLWKAVADKSTVSQESAVRHLWANNFAVDPYPAWMANKSWTHANAQREQLGREAAQTVSAGAVTAEHSKAFRVAVGLAKELAKMRKFAGRPAGEELTRLVRKQADVVAFPALEAELASGHKVPDVDFVYMVGTHS